MRFKIVACILLILSVFGFVLAAPVAVQRVREACADAVEGDENVIIVSGKRAPRANRYETEEDLSPMDVYPPESPDTEQRTSPSQSSSPPNHASGSHSSVDMPSSSSLASGSESPPTTKVHIFEPDLPNEDQQASPPPGETKSVSWGPSNKVLLPSGKVISVSLPPPEVEPLPLPPGREGYLVKQQQSPSPEIEHASPSSYFDPPPPPQSKGVVGNFKKVFGKLGKLNFRPREFQRVRLTLECKYLPLPYLPCQPP